MKWKELKLEHYYIVDLRYIGKGWIVDFDRDGLQTSGNRETVNWKLNL